MDVLEDAAALDLRRFVRSGDVVVCSEGLSEPLPLTQRLVEQRHGIGRFTLFLGPTYSRTFAPEHGDIIAFQSYCGTGRNASLMAAGALEIVPGHFSDYPRFFDEGTLRCDVVLMMVSEADENGHRYALNNDYVFDAARRARTVIFEISDKVPHTPGARLPPDIRPAAAVRTGREPLLMQEAAGASDIDRAIASHAASLVPDGATIELGIGTLPDMVLDALRRHRDLGFHAGVMGDKVMELMQLGVITNARKPFDIGVTVAGLLMGTRRLLDYVHRNERVRLAPAGHTHDKAVLAAIPNFIAINGAIEVDLTGQVNAEMLNGRYIGATGGQVDFTRGGNASRGGRSIILLQSTVRDGSASRILERLSGSAVTMSRADADVVVTEWGIAELRGKTLAERAKAMIAIAHPDFRTGLERFSFSRGAV